MHLRGADKVSSMARLVGSNGSSKAGSTGDGSDLGGQDLDDSDVELDTDDLAGEEDGVDTDLEETSEDAQAGDE
jgi:hypothetical protein